MGSSLRFDRAPRRVYWEVTRACDLACRHCRAVAAPAPHAAELTGRDGLALLDQLAGFGAPLPHLVLTGGDPLKRPDLSSPRAASRDPVLGSGKSGPIPTFPPHSHVGSHRIPNCWSW
jgi:hypothetical protein